MFSRHESDTAICLNYWGTENEDNLPSANEISQYNLIGDGDFRSWECIEILKMADIVVTNPPFSLLREYVAQLIEYDKKFLILGQQNAISLCQYFDKQFSVTYNGRQKECPALPADIRHSLLDYELNIYLCDGTDSEKLDWFRVVNIAGVKLTEQELRNAVYAGPWLADAKGDFSRINCRA